MMNNRFFMRTAALLMSVLMLPFYALTYGIDAFSAGKRTETKHENIVGIGAYFRSQGITADEQGNLYFSSKTTLLKTESNGRDFIAANYSAIPAELKENCGIKHIGGLSYYNGKIYAGLEDSKVWQHPIIGVYDCETLELIEWFELDCTVHTRGLPWVTVDKDTGILYAFDHSKQPKAILSYDINDSMKPLGRTELAETVPSIQGAEMTGGTLYAATNDDTRAIYKINVETGEWEKIIDRNLTGGSEGEGMTLCTVNGRLFALAMDMGPLFINSNLRWYELPAAE